ncbi:MAG: nucleotide exchange factor GrpE [Burkholderiaceae bacterium]|nr:MAG: nucleotide exchange factor GrpE [Burkholderiaceae bacterium]
MKKHAHHTHEHKEHDRAETSSSVSPAEPSPPESAVEPSLEQQLAAAQAKAQENHDQFLRARAEAENIRRRAQDDVTKAYKFAIESFAEALVPVKDSLEAALADTVSDPAKLKEGVELTLRQLTAAFEKGRVQEINPVGQKFDPHQHQAVAMVPAPEGIAPNHVVTVMQKGYLIADRVLRPALVAVAQG